GVAGRISMARGSVTEVGRSRGAGSCAGTPSPRGRLKGDRRTIDFVTLITRRRHDFSTRSSRDALPDVHLQRRLSRGEAAARAEVKGADILARSVCAARRRALTPLSPGGRGRKRSRAGETVAGELAVDVDFDAVDLDVAAVPQVDDHVPVEAGLVGVAGLGVA